MSFLAANTSVKTEFKDSGACDTLSLAHDSWLFSSEVEDAPTIGKFKFTPKGRRQSERSLGVVWTGLKLFLAPKGPFTRCHFVSCDMLQVYYTSCFVLIKPATCLRFSCATRRMSWAFENMF